MERLLQVNILHNINILLQVNILLSIKLLLQVNILLNKNRMRLTKQLFIIQLLLRIRVVNVGNVAFVGFVLAFSSFIGVVAVSKKILVNTLN
jgi:hypothetical protein